MTGRSLLSTAQLLQAPLVYPDLDSQHDDVFAAGSAQTRRSRRTAQAPTSVLDAQKKVRERDLKANAHTVLEPDTNDAAVNTTVTVTADVTWTDPSGAVAPWPHGVYVKYGADKFSGPGPHDIAPKYQYFEKKKGDAKGKWYTHDIEIHVGVWNGSTFASRVIERRPLRGHCGLRVDIFDEETQYFIALVYGEGGQMKAVRDEEVERIAWTIRNRVDLLRQLYAADPGDATMSQRLKAVKKFGEEGSYLAVAKARNQFDAYDKTNWHKALHPERILTKDECDSLDRCIRIVSAISRDSPDFPDRDRFEGNPRQFGTFFFQTKDDWRKRTKWNEDHQAQIEANPLDRRFAPEWDKVRAESTDRHYYWGLEPQGAYAP